MSGNIDPKSNAKKKNGGDVMVVVLRTKMPIVLAASRCVLPSNYISSSKSSIESNSSSPSSKSSSLTASAVTSSDLFAGF